jgi:hypothetical protein
MLSGESRLYSEFADGIVIEAGHFLMRKRSLLSMFAGQITVLDTRTPAFQGVPEAALDPRTQRIRTSYLRLAACHGGPIWRRFSHLEPVKPADLTRSACKQVASNALDLQASVKPSLLLPPYFAFARFDDPWLPVNKTLFDSMCELADGLPVYLPIAFDHSLLEDARAVEQICEIVSDAGAEGCAVWPVGLDEMSASAQELAAMGRLLQMLPHPSVLLYAGYFSMLLCAENGSSFSSGPCFYEKPRYRIIRRKHTVPLLEG